MNSNKHYKNKENAMDYCDNKLKSTPVAMVAPELKHNTDEMEITKTCAVLGCEDSKNLDPEMFFRFPEDLSLRQIWTDLTGRNNWTPTDYSYMCMQHFSVDCFMCNEYDQMVLVDKAVPSQKLPRHVLEVEYIDEETLDNEDEDYMETGEDYLESEDDLDSTEMNHEDMDQTETDDKEMAWKELISNEITHTEVGHNEMARKDTSQKVSPRRETNYIVMDKKEMARHNINHKETDHKEKEYKPFNGSMHIDINDTPQIQTDLENIELLKLFTEVQKMQRQCVALKDKLKYNTRVHNKQSRFLLRIKEMTEIKKKILNQKRKKKCRILLSLQDKIKEDTTGLVLAMPMRQTEDLKNFALSVYKYSPQAYIYIRNMLRTMLPSTEVLDSWVTSGFEPKNVMTSSNLINVVAEQSETELSCKVTLG